MEIGDMRDRITLLKKKEQSGPVVDLSNNNYTEYKTIWAKVEYWKSSEVYSAKAVNIMDTLKFITRYRTDIKNDMRIKYNDEYYDIKSIKPFGQGNRQWLIVVGELVKHE